MTGEGRAEILTAWGLGFEQEGAGGGDNLCAENVVVVLTLTRIIKSVVTGRAPVTLELRNTPGKNTNNPRWYTHTFVYHS